VRLLAGTEEEVSERRVDSSTLVFSLSSNLILNVGASFIEPNPECRFDLMRLSLFRFIINRMSEPN
jgi:hypothetical protein